MIPGLCLPSFRTIGPLRVSQNDVTFLKSLFLKIGTNLNKVEKGFLKNVAKNLGISLESVSYDPRIVPTKFQNHKTSTGVTKSMSRF